MFMFYPVMYQVLYLIVTSVNLGISRILTLDGTWLMVLSITTRPGTRVVTSAEWRDLLQLQG